ncbi:MAG: hypothetical protein KIT09_08695 [Bryobacteraceae bacterium]|nr:hypothetical protein [Bryobacteraceae bacterium]
MKTLFLAFVPLFAAWAGVEKFCADPASAELLNKTGEASVTACDAAERRKLPAPRVNLQVNVASATRAPWIIANGWRFLRNPGGKYFYEASAGKATLAMAEAFAYNADAGFKIDPADAEQAGRMLAFLRALPESDLPPMSDFAFVDDGTGVAGEAMNLMTRRNLLYAVVRQPDSRYAFTVVPGNDEFPRKLAANPGNFATAVRQKLTDEKRSIRLYGSEMAIIRAAGDGKAARLHILNYADRPLEGIRLRVRGAYSKADVHAFTQADAAATEFVVEDGFTEFSIPQMGVYAVVDLR